MCITLERMTLMEFPALTQFFNDLYIFGGDLLHIAVTIGLA